MRDRGRRERKKGGGGGLYPENTFSFLFFLFFHTDNVVAFFDVFSVGGGAGGAV